MIKVAIVSTIQPETHYTRYLYSSLTKIYNNIYLLVDDNPENNEYIKSQDKRKVVKLWKPNLSLPIRLVQFVRSNKISIVHLQHEFNMYGGIKGIPVFLLTLILLKLYRIKTVVTIHAVVDYREVDDDFLNTFTLSKYKKVKKLIKLLFFLFYKILGVTANKIIVHSEYTKQIYTQAYKINPIKCNVIPIGIETTINSDSSSKIFDNQEPKWFEQIKNKRIILFFGYILKRKGLELLIESYRNLHDELPNSVLVIAGGILENQKEYAEYLVKLVQINKFENDVIFTGFLSENELNYLYNKCEFLVLPYNYSISSSLPLSLALGAGKPVIASDVGTLKDEIIDNVSGLFFRNGDLEDLKSKIYTLYNNPDIISKLQEGMLVELSVRSWYNIAMLTNVVYGDIK